VRGKFTAGAAEGLPFPKLLAADAKRDIEPLNGVSYAQQARDRYECDIQAVDQTGFDPTKDDGGPPPNVTAKRVDYLRAEAACFQARGYGAQ
jgi:L-alanine-DL-glutamate epimerase-like enolase superfamily enzyme